MRNTVAGLIREGRFSEAVSLDGAFLRRQPDAGSLIDDGGFESRDRDYGTNATPFDWMIWSGSASLDEADGRRIAISVDEQHRQGGVQRYVRLDPGQYRLSFSIQGDRNGPLGIALTAECVSPRSALGASPRQPLSGDGWERRSFDFAVPDACPLVVLQIRPFGEPLQADALIDDIKLERRENAG